jgi:ribonuclease HII
VLSARLKYKRLEAGCDEVGRGCLSGPVVAAAVILPPRFKHVDIIDSKKLSEKKRVQMVQLIKKKAISWAVSEVSPEVIDEINILNASFLAMTQAVQQLKVRPEFLLIDGNRFRSKLEIPFECIIKGDSKIGSIAAASILAKDYRDNLMKRLHDDHPEYGWNTNVGYPTITHRKAIENVGITIYHRRTFNVKKVQLELKFDSDKNKGQGR